MDSVNPEAKTFLFELYTQTNGDTKIQVSTHDVGAVLGLEKTDAESMAQDLIIQGYAELKTLSGGIGITLSGLELLEIKIAPESSLEALSLGSGPVLENKGKKNVEKIIHEVLRSLHKNFVSFGPEEVSKALNSLIIS